MSTPPPTQSTIAAVCAPAIAYERDANGERRQVRWLTDHVECDQADARPTHKNVLPDANRHIV